MLTTHEHAGLDLSRIGDECRFCEVAQRETVIRESEHATAFPSLGALVEGWVLVAPREHVVALAHLSGEAWRDLSDLAQACEADIGAAYGPTVMFEHGAAGAGRTAGCGVDHAHLHVVPWTGSLRDQVAAVPDLETLTWQPAGDRPLARTGHDYIWVADHTGAWITYAPRLPSQVVRQAMSHNLGLNWWDWKADLRIQVAAATLDRLGRAG